LHGSLFGILRPNPLQANNFFNNRNGIKRPNADYGLYGGSIGGPVYIPKIYNGKNKTFFWVAMEGYRMQSFLSETFTVPTDLERQGNFSQTKNGGQPVVIYDPLTTRTVNGQLVRDPFGGAVIPLNRQYPVGRALLQFFPKANRPGDASGRNNYAATSTLDDRADQQTFKLDFREPCSLPLAAPV
jgi:trimeric autotransporter adhesin